MAKVVEISNEEEIPIEVKGTNTPNKGQETTKDEKGEVKT